MKTQIIRRIFAVLIATLFTLNNNNGSNFQQSVKINFGIITADVNYSFTSLDIAKDLESISCHIHCTKVQHDEPFIPEPNGDNEFHVFDLKHHIKHSFWKNILNKVVSAIYYLVVLIIYMPHKF